MNVSLLEVDIISQVCCEICSKIRVAEQVVSMDIPLVSYSTTVFPRKVTMDNVTHAENGFTPAENVQQMFFGNVGKDIFEGNSPMLTDDEVLVGCTAGVQGSLALGVSKIL
jgi:hypothetical protein